MFFLDKRIARPVCFFLEGMRDESGEGGAGGGEREERRGTFFINYPFFTQKVLIVQKSNMAEQEAI